MAWKRVLSSTFGGLFGIAVLIGLASAIGWTLNALGWSPERGATRMGDIVFLAIGLGGFALLALYVFGCGRA